ncbi:M10 family metallopeptidase C-terminal domain-containing protein [Novosphingobium sp.]|uniref:beta strand repeat-containing protein n=1 Tax=Novosphingobium sp. TaxID=1874826 RepID=UPI002BB5B657|nr:M10 family metallopeptidase C-terminal domain-containing protein [Novosphingobium sp.]HQV04926.1 M10 family metallopeptidase C-terminal domain-containing protein [Novosphingobium sp.]
MPLIPSYPIARPTTATVTETIINTPTAVQVQGEWRYVYTVDSGSTLYAVNLQTLFDAFPYSYTVPGLPFPFTSDAFFDITNNGTIWMSQFPEPFGYGGRFLGRNVANFTNNGMVVMETVGEIEFGSTLTAFNDGRGRMDSFTNTGSFYIINTTANSISGVTLLTSYNFDIEVSNSGLIAIQAAGGLAYGIGLANGGHIVNSATGQILVEGLGAVGVASSFSMAPIGIENYGRIEVNSLNGDAAIAVKIIADEIQNYAGGIIIGDVSVFGSGRFINAGLAIGVVLGQTSGNLDVTNQVGGQIQGSILLGDVDDILTNQGTITGNVAMGAGTDLVDNRGGGTISGITDLGLGSDTYHGEAGQDLVAGDAGNDTIYGYAGEDLLLGGYGNDTLDGGGGADGLYGEAGSDILITQGADNANGGAGDDEVRLGDYTFAFLDGAGGFDTLVLASGARVFDLSAALSLDRLTDFEAIRLVGAQELVLRGADVQGLSGGDSELVVTLTGTDKLDLVGAWTANGPVTRGGVTYSSYILGGSTVLVTGGGTIAVMASAPVGAVGLDPVAAGAAAPMPGTGGLNLTPSVLFVQYLEIREDTVIDLGDTWYTVGTLPALWSQIDGPLTTINGTLQSFNPDSARSQAILHGNQQAVIVNGFVGSYSDGPLLAQVPGYFPSTPEGANAIVQASSVTNNGVIEAVSALGTASGVGMAVFSPGMDGGLYGEDIPDTFSYNSIVPTVVNTGRIEAVSNARHAFGVSGSQSFSNAAGAVVQVSGFLAAAAVVGEGTFTNHGTISAAISPGAPGTSFGIVVTNNVERPAGHLITNSGSITAQYALWIQDVYGNQGFAPNTVNLNNSGLLAGAIRSGNGSDVFVNTGTITGVIELRDGNDSFDGRTGVQSGAIHGGAGSDTIQGGSGNEVISGGTGLDSLQGFGGNDRLVILSPADVVAGETYDGGLGTDTLYFDFSGDPAPLVDITGVNLVSLERLEGLGGSTVRLTGSQLTAFSYVGGPNVQLATGGSIILAGTMIGSSAIFLADLVTALDLSTATSENPAQAITIYGGALGDTVIGSAGRDFLIGYAGNDNLSGGDGADFLVGGIGADTLNGGNGNDGFAIDSLAELSAGDTINGGDGIDSLQITFIEGNADYRLLSVTGVETLYAISGEYLLTIPIADLKTFSTIIGNFFVLGSGSQNLAGQNISGSIIQMVDAITSFDISGATGGATVSGGASDNTLTGGVQEDHLLGANGNDTVYGGGGGDWIYGDGLEGQTGNDTLFGQDGNDFLYGGAGNDVLDGGAGANMLFGEAGDDRLIVGAGAYEQMIDGGDGIDTLALTADYTLVGDMLGIERIELGAFEMTLDGTQFNTGLASNATITGTGSLTVNMVSGQILFLTPMTIASTVTIEANGTSGIDVIKGPIGAAMTVSAGGGTDQIRTGNLADTIDGGADNDKIMGLGGADNLTGGSGADQFRYLFASDSTLAAQDRILDFTTGTDKLDFRALDADPLTAGRQTISFIGTSAFATNGTAQARYVDSGADKLVQIDLNGDGAADMQIVLVGHAGQGLTGTDFLF